MALLNFFPENDWITKRQPHQLGMLLEKPVGQGMTPGHGSFRTSPSDSQDVSAHMSMTGEAQVQCSHSDCVPGPPCRGLKMEEQHLPRKLFQFPNHRPPQFPPQFPNHCFSSFRIRNKLHFRRPSPHLWKSILTSAQKNRFPIDFAAGLGRGHCTGFTTQTHGEKL